MKRLRSGMIGLILAMAIVGGNRPANARVSSPGNVLFSSPAALTTSAVFDSTGTFVLQFASSDGIAVSTKTVIVTVVGAAPGTVSDLTSSIPTSNGASLSFTEVNDGLGSPAKYDVRFSSASSLIWSAAASVSSGTCLSPMTGTLIGAPKTCTVLGLIAGTTYQFQLVAYRGTLNVNAVFGGFSNTVTATTLPPLSTSPILTVGGASGVIAGNTWGVYTTLSTGTVGVASLQFDAMLPPGASTATVTAGPAAIAASKSVASNAISGGIRVLVFGVNQTLINSGVVAILNIQTDPTLPAGSLPIPVVGVIGSDPLGVNVPMIGVNGSLLVTANKAPVVTIGANQTITLPAPANLTATASDDGAPNPPGILTYIWSVL